MIIRSANTRRIVVSLLVFAVMLIIGALSASDSPVLHWRWLQQHAYGFYVTKGLVATVATVLVIAHMQQVWREAMQVGQRLRYLALFYLTALVAASSLEQLQQSPPVNTRNVGGLGGALFVIVAMVVSISDNMRPPLSNQRGQRVA